MVRDAKRQLKVFLCHASGDKPPVRDLYKRLTVEGVDPWLDKEKLLPGQDWRLEIPKAVQEADVVVVCLSNKSVTKEGYVQKEIKFALDSAEEKPEGAIFLIPARLEECPVPERLSRWQWVDLYEENGFVQLLRSLKVRADAVGAVIEPSSYVDSDKETERRLEQLYTEGLAAFYTEDWDRACQHFQSILSERSNHTAASEKLAEAERQRDLAKLYAGSLEAYQAENWQTAIHTLDELTKKCPEYKDASSLLKDARKRQHVHELYAEAERLYSAQQWQAVVKVFDQISIVDPTFLDTKGYLVSAQQEVAEIKRIESLNNQYSHALHEMEKGNWYDARRLLETIRKSETGFLEAEKLLRKAENEITREEEKHKQNDQINTLYEQAHGLLRSKKWRNALEKMEEIGRLDEHFPDADGIVEKAQKELTREEQEAEHQNKLAAMYAEAVKLLKEEKYQEALDKWQEVKDVDPKYPDRQWVERTVKKRLAGTRTSKGSQNDLKTRLGKILLHKDTVPSIEAESSIAAQTRAGWLILFVAVSWGIGRFAIELVARLTGFFGLGANFLSIEIIVVIFGMFYGVTIWFMLRSLKIVLDNKKAILLVMGWLMGISIVPVVSWNSSEFTYPAWILAGLIAGLCTGLILRSLGVLPDVKQSLILMIGLTVSIYGGEQIFGVLGLMKSVSISAMGAAPRFGLGSFVSGLFCVWILLIQLRTADEAHKRSRQQARFFVGAALLVMIGFVPLFIRDPFAGAIGMWEATDHGDQSHMTISVQRVLFTNYEFFLEDQSAGMCNGGPGLARFSGRPIGNQLVTTIVFTCNFNSNMITRRGYAIKYDPDADRLTDSDGIPWHRME